MPAASTDAPHSRTSSAKSDLSWSRAIDTSALVSSDDPDPLHAIEMCTNYMLALLSDVLNVGRFENGAVKLDNVSVDLGDLVRSVVAMAQARAGSKGIVFRAEVGFFSIFDIVRTRSLASYGLDSSDIATDAQVRRVRSTQAPTDFAGNYRHDVFAGLAIYAGDPLGSFGRNCSWHSSSGGSDSQDTRHR